MDHGDLAKWFSFTMSCHLVIGICLFIFNSVSKILETALFDYIDSYDPVDEYQFGFRKKCFHFLVYTCSQEDCAVLQRAW